MNMIYDMVILGGGPGGYTAALYAARAGLSVALVERISAGGQMTLTGDIDNYPGFPDGVDGFELGMRMQQQAERFGAVTHYAEVTGLDLKAEPKIVETAEGVIRARTVAIALGAAPPEAGSAQGRGAHGPGRPLLRPLRRNVLPE